MTRPTRISHLPRRDGPLPEGAKYVGRPSRWGNPYKVKALTRTWHVQYPSGRSVPAESLQDAHGWACLKYRENLNTQVRWGLEMNAFLTPLRDAAALACACPLDMPCHVDVLIELLEVTA